MKIGALPLDAETTDDLVEELREKGGNFVASFLEGLESEDRRQFIFTTHEIQLMRSDLLRRDEIWLTDKVDDESQLTRLSDFSRDGVRKDANLLGFYLSGRIGGIPHIELFFSVEGKIEEQYIRSLLDTRYKGPIRSDISSKSEIAAVYEDFSY